MLQSLSPVLARYDPFGVDVPLNFDNTHSLTHQTTVSSNVGPGRTYKTENDRTTITADFRSRDTGIGIRVNTSRYGTPNVNYYFYFCSTVNRPHVMGAFFAVRKSPFLRNRQGNKCQILCGKLPTHRISRWFSAFFFWKFAVSALHTPFVIFLNTGFHRTEDCKATLLPQIASELFHTFLNFIFKAHKKPVFNWFSKNRLLFFLCVKLEF